MKSKKNISNKNTPDIRYLYDIKDVLFDKKWLKTAKNLELYYMYRGVKARGDLRYDITVIPPQMLGKEFTRTKGNKNWKNFPELYMVLGGQAIFLMQKALQKKTTKDVVVVKAKKGESVIVPAKYNIVTINPSKSILKAGNWVSNKNNNIYGDIEIMKGPAYFYTKLGWIKNKNYSKVPKLRFEKSLPKLPKDLTFLKG